MRHDVLKRMVCVFALMTSSVALCQDASEMGNSEVLALDANAAFITANKDSTPQPLALLFLGSVILFGAASYRSTAARRLLTKKIYKSTTSSPNHLTN